MDAELYYAVSSGNHTYLDNPSNNLNKFLQVTSYLKNTILHIAAQFGQTQTAGKIIDSCASLLHQQNSKGDSPLHVAARFGNLEIAKLLINRAKGLEVEVKKLLKMENLNKDTALHEAARYKHISIVQLLISEDSELTTVVNKAGESPLFLAVDRNFHKIAWYILNAAPRCAYGGRNSMNVLHAAIIRREKTKYHNFIKGFMREVLRRYPSAITEADMLGWFPIHYAAYFGNLQVIELLLEFDISLAKAKDNQGKSPLHIAAKAGQNDVILILIAKCPDIVELLDNKGRTALHIAVVSGKDSVVHTFLCIPLLGDVINERDTDGNTPYHLAALQENTKILRILAIDDRVDKKAANNSGLTVADINDYGQKESLQSLEHTVIIRETKQGQDSETRERTENKEPGNDNEVKELREIVNLYLVIATIIASVSFAAGMSMPGGYNNDSDIEHAGMAILSRKSAFGAFVIANSLAFGFSATSMMLPFVITTIKSSSVKILLGWPSTFLLFSIIALMIAFLTGTYVVLGTSPGLAIAALVVGCFSCFASLVPLFSTWHKRLRTEQHNRLMVEQNQQKYNRLMDEHNRMKTQQIQQMWHKRLMAKQIQQMIQQILRYNRRDDKQIQHMIQQILRYSRGDGEQIQQILDDEQIQQILDGKQIQQILRYGRRD